MNTDSLKDQRLSLHLSICFSNGKLSLSLQKHSICIQKSCLNIISKVLQFFREWLTQTLTDFIFLQTVIRQEIASGKSKKNPTSNKNYNQNHQLLNSYSMQPNTHSSHICHPPQTQQHASLKLHLTVTMLAIYIFFNRIY